MSGLNLMPQKNTRFRRIDLRVGGGRLVNYKKLALHVHLDMQTFDFVVGN